LLLETLQKSKTRIIIPTPALSEFLARADIKLLDRINTASAFKIVSFDQRAAIEAAEMTRKAIRESDKKGPAGGATWAKIKFDRQIVAIAKVENATTIYSTDEDVAKHAKQYGIACFGIADLPLPPAMQELLPGVGSDPSTKEE
jgi:predicted nucleic acid-binding protein